MTKHYHQITVLILLAALVAACTSAPTPTPPPTAVPPTSTTVPSTPTALPATPTSPPPASTPTAETAVIPTVTITTMTAPATVEEQTIESGTEEIIEEGNLIPEYRPITSNYMQSIEDGGTIERVDYTTAYNGEIYEKHAYVYLPAGYDTTGEASYDVFYLMHGGAGRAETFFGGEGQSSSLKNILDNMIRNKELEPLIVVTPSYYKPGDSDDGALTQEFHEELLNDLMPAVEGTHHTYAQTPDKEGFQESRKHRAFGGFSMGSVTTWYTFVYDLDYFKYYLPMSGDSWILGMMGGNSRADETAAYLVDVVRESGYGVNDFFIYAATGTNDMAYDAETHQIEAMKAHKDTFIYCNDMNKCNLYYNVAEGGEHTYSYMNEYIYNALPYLFVD
jgi:hypothetical protein